MELRDSEEVSVLKARIKFRKYGALRFIGHLDVMRYFQKVMRRADIPIAFTGGYSPHMIMSFASPLGIGLESDGEYLDIELTEPVESREAVRRMNEAGVDGIEVVSLRQIAEEKKMTGMTILAAADYLIIPAVYAEQKDMRRMLPEDWQLRFRAFTGQDEIRVVKQTKRSEREVNLRPLIYHWEFRGDNIYMKLAAGSTENLKPDLVMDAFLKTILTDADEASCYFTYRRLEMYADVGEDGERKLVTLESLGEEI